MFITTLFIVVRTWKPSKCSSIKEWIKKLWYKHTMECHSSMLCCAYLLSPVQLFLTPLTIAHQAPLYRGFSRQEYWSGLSCLPPLDLPNPGIESRSPTLQTDSLLSEPPGKPYSVIKRTK